MLALVIALIIVGIVLQLFKEWVEPKIYLLALIIIVLAVCLIILNWFVPGLLGTVPLRR